MLFLWTITKHGKIWLDGEAFRRIAVNLLPPEFVCREVSFVGDQSLINIYITLPEKDDPRKRLEVTGDFERFFEPTGIAARINWIRETPEEYVSDYPILKKPIFWATAAGGLAAVANLGVRGVLWAAGAALAGYAVSWTILSEEGKNIIKKIAKDFRR
ncbi:MAG: hypothetical protein LBE65_02230 [Synergistaceae bacterium]|jgi:hypothetical protein|nr:hypothetical protein [Synergistaceae bacterium]